MTQEQRINRGSIVIFILSIVLILCLTLTATLAYFAGSDVSNTTLVIGGPVTVTMVDGNNQQEYGANKLVMGIRSDTVDLRPGTGIDLRASAMVWSSDIDPTPALLRAVISVSVESTGNPFVSQATMNKVKETLPGLIRESMMTNLDARVDSTEVGPKPGWVFFDGAFYYCSEERDGTDIMMEPIVTNASGRKIKFLDGVFLMPTTLTNDYSNLAITITLTFQAIQEVLKDDNGKTIKNSIENVKEVLDAFTDDDWDRHNSV